MTKAVTIESGKLPVTSIIRYEMLDDRVALESIKEDVPEKIGSIYIPVNSREEYAEDLARAKVVAIGPKVIKVSIGDIVITPKRLGTKLVDGKKEYVVLPENAMMAIDTKFEG